MKRPLCGLTFGLAILIGAPEAPGVINYGRDNDANTSDPGGGVPWANVGRITNSTGTAVTVGSAVYLGDRFVLTANHVDPNNTQTHITFDGATFLAIEPGSHQQVAPNVDLKVIRLATDPGLPALLLYEDAVASQDLSQGSSLVGWGRGRDPGVDVNTDVVPWGTDATIAKRWGTNTTLPTATTLSYTQSSVSYSYEALQTHLLNTAGPDEAAVTLYDSGGALFQQIDGVWYLSGIATAVQTSGSSTFGPTIDLPPSLGDLNFFARVATYSDNIYAVIPEPSTWAAVAGLAAFFVVLARRRFGRSAGV